MTKFYKPNAEFNTDLKRGQTGEQAFLEKFDVIKLDGFGPDFATKSGTLIELKTDYYDMNRTPNLFLETQSRAGKLGGPAQALSKGSKLYIYYFIKNDKFLIYSTVDLVEYLNSIDQDPITIKNPSYETTGVLINREAIAHLELSKESVGLHERSTNS